MITICMIERPVRVLRTDSVRGMFEAYRGFRVSIHVGSCISLLDTIEDEHTIRSNMGEWRWPSWHVILKRVRWFVMPVSPSSTHLICHFDFSPHFNSALLRDTGPPSVFLSSRILKTKPSKKPSEENSFSKTSIYHGPASLFEFRALGLWRANVIVPSFLLVSYNKRLQIWNKNLSWELSVSIFKS